MAKRTKKTQLEGLHEVKGAGYTETKKVKRDKTVNRRAGLHDKIKKSEGEVRVKRRKPLGLKHVRRMRKVAAVASVGVVGAIAVVGVGFLAPAKDVQRDEDFKTVCLVAPTDGTKPTDHTLVENVGYMNYVLQNQPYWSSVGKSTVIANVGVSSTQTVDTYKQYYNDVLIQTDIALNSTLASLNYGEQFCQTDGVVLTRKSTSKSEEELKRGVNAPWSAGPATGWTVKGFKANRGFPPYEFSVYVLNEKTIANAQDYTVVDNQDGTYSMTLELNVNTGVDETSAEYYYVLQMKANGNLYDLPTIFKTTVTYTFDENWRVLSCESGDTNKTTPSLGLTANCTSNSKTSYYYDEASAKNTFWEDYYKGEYDRQKDALKDDETASEGNADTAFGYLSSAFASVLSEGAVFKIDLNIDELDLSGVVSVEMADSSLSGLTAKLGDFLAWLDGDTLYITDGSSKYKLNIGGLFSSDESGEEGINAQGLTDGLDVNALMEQMTDGEFVVDAETGVATLVSEVELFGLKIDMQFEFQKSESGIALNFLKAQIPLGDKTVNAQLCFGTESDKPAIPTDTSDYQDILNDGITFDVNAEIDGLALDGIAKIFMRDGQPFAVDAILGNFEVYYNCPRNMLYLSAAEAKYSLDLSKIKTGDTDISAILGNIDFKSILNNLTTGEGSLGSSFLINIDALESLLEVAFNVKLNGGLTVGADLTLGNHSVSLTAALTNKKLLPPDVSGYKDILNTDITLDVSATLLTGLYDSQTGTRDEVTLNGKVALCLSNGKLNEIRADFGGLAIYYEFAANSLYLKVGTTKALIRLDEISVNDLNSLSLGSAFLSEDLPTVINELLNNLVIESKIISVDVNLNVMDALVPVWAELDLENLSVRAGFTVFGVDAALSVGLSNTPLYGLSEEEKEEYIDVVKDGFKIIDNLIGDHISATVQGSVFSYEDKYGDYDNEKYSFGASLEYDKGAENFDENKAYVHLNVALTARHPDDDSLYIDIVLMDANPVTGADGRTTGGYTQDGKFDIYLSVSKYAENSVPLMIYAPVDEILTLLSMVCATANLDQIKVENSEELTSIIGQISDLLDGMLVSQYLPKSVQDKFASLGDSLIPQILGVSLEELLNGLFGNIDTTVKQAESTKISLADSYVSSITATDETLKFVLNSSLIYNKENLDNLTVTFERALYEGVYKVSGISVDNIFFGDNEVNKLDISMQLGYDEVTRPNADSAFVGYLNADGLDTLVNGLINSATHKVDGTEDEYDLNHYYLLNGKVTAAINVIGIKVNANIYIKSLAVYIDENNEVAINAHIYYDGVQQLNQIAIAGDSDVYLSIQGGNICIKRIQYTHYETSGLITKEVTDNPAKEEVRSMTLKEFSDDLMDNLTFIFNFGPVILNNIPDSGSSDNSGVSFDGLDFGACLNTVIAAYVTEETSTGASWTVSLNGDLIKAYTGMKTSNIPVKFSADLNADGTYTVKSLEILKTSMELFGSAVKLELTGNLTYCNPNEQMGEGYTDTSKDLYNMSVTVNGDYELPYIESNFTWACGSYVKLPVGVAGTFDGNSYILDGYTATTRILGTQNVQFVDFVEEDGVRYGLIRLISDTEYTAIWNKAYVVTFVDENGVELYSTYYHENEVLNFGNMPACPERDGYTSQWVGENGVAANGCAVTENMTFKVEYTKAPLKVALNSTVEFNYTGYDGNYKLLNVGFEEGVNYTLADATAEGYAFLGWWYNDNGEWRKITSVEEFVDAGAVSLEALWVKVTVNGSGVNSSSAIKNNYSVSASVGYEFSGNGNICDELKITPTKYSWASYSWGTWNNRTQAETSEFGYAFKNESSSKFDTYEKWRVTVDITVELPDGTQTNLTLSDEGNF